MEHVSAVSVSRAIIVSPAAAVPEEPFSLEDAPAFQAFMAETQRLVREGPVLGSAAFVGIPLQLILERSLWAVMARVAQKAGIVFTNETTLVDVAAAQATLLLAVALPFAYATPTAAAEAFLATMPPVPSRLVDAGEVWLQAAAQAATSFFAVAIREATARARRSREAAAEIRHRNRIRHRNIGELLEADTFGFIPNEVLDVLLGTGEIADLEFHVLTDSGVEKEKLSRRPWKMVSRWAESERRIGDVERDIEAALPTVATLEGIPNDVQVPRMELVGAWVRTQILLAALGAHWGQAWIESSELPFAVMRAVEMSEASLRAAFVSRLESMVGAGVAWVFLERFSEMVDRHIRSILGWKKNPVVKGPDLAGLIVRISTAPSPAVARAVMAGGAGAVELRMGPDEAFAAFDWPTATIEDFRLAMPALKDDPWKMAQAFFSLPEKQRDGEADLRGIVEYALEADHEACAAAARRAWVSLTWKRFEAISAGLAPHEALVVLERFLRDTAEDTADAERRYKGLFVALLRRVEPAAFQELAWNPGRRGDIRVAILRDVLNMGAEAGRHLALPLRAFGDVLRVFGEKLWSYYLLSIELSYRDEVWEFSFEKEVPQGRWFEPWPRMTQILRGNAEVNPADLGPLLGVDDRRRSRILADLTESKILRWTLEGDPSAKKASAEYMERRKAYFAARGLTPDGRSLGAKSAPVPVERKARPSSALPSRLPRKR